MAKFDTVEAYVAAQPAPVQEILNELRRRVADAVPSATETISYDIPTFKLDGKPLIHVGAWTKHIAVYPAPHGGDEGLQRDVERYRSGKGTLKFQLGEPFPYELFDRLVQAALGERS
jgi:uncharacterized protein YdhG (YjbR/CyaY superfamily)